MLLGKNWSYHFCELSQKNFFLSVFSVWIGGGTNHDYNLCVLFKFFANVPMLLFTCSLTLSCTVCTLEEKNSNSTFLNHVIILACYKKRNDWSSGKKNWVIFQKKNTLGFYLPKYQEDLCCYCLLNIWHIMPNVCNCLGLFLDDSPLPFSTWLTDIMKIVGGPNKIKSCHVLITGNSHFHLGTLKKSLRFQISFPRHYTEVKVFW